MLSEPTDILYKCDVYFFYINMCSTFISPERMKLQFKSLRKDLFESDETEKSTTFSIVSVLGAYCTIEVFGKKTFFFGQVQMCYLKNSVFLQEISSV